MCHYKPQLVYFLFYPVFLCGLHCRAVGNTDKKKDSKTLSPRPLVNAPRAKNSKCSKHAILKMLKIPSLS